MNNRNPSDKVVKAKISTDSTLVKAKISTDSTQHHTPNGKRAVAKILTMRVTFM